MITCAGAGLGLEHPERPISTPTPIASSSTPTPGDQRERVRALLRRSSAPPRAVAVRRRGRRRAGGRPAAVHRGARCSSRRGARRTPGSSAGPPPSARRSSGTDRRGTGTALGWRSIRLTPWPDSDLLPGGLSAVCTAQRARASGLGEHRPRTPARGREHPVKSRPPRPRSPRSHRIDRPAVGVTLADAARTARPRASQARTTSQPPKQRDTEDSTMRAFSPARRIMLSVSVLALASLAAPIASPARTRVRLPHATTGPAQHVIGNTALLTGAVNPNGRETSWYFQYGLTTAYTSQTPTQTIGPSSTTNQRVGQARLGAAVRIRLPLPLGGEQRGGDVPRQGPHVRRARAQAQIRRAQVADGRLRRQRDLQRQPHRVRQPEPPDRAAGEPLPLSRIVHEHRRAGSERRVRAASPSGSPTSPPAPSCA